MVCSECIGKLNALKIPYKMKISPHTGQLSAMVQGRPLIVTDPVVNPPAGYLDSFKSEFTNYLVAQGADAYCDKVDFIGTDLQATWLPSFWATVDVTASGELVVLGTDGRLLMIWDDLVALAVLCFTTHAFWVDVGLIILLAIVIVVVGYLTAQAQYNYTDPSGNPAKGTWSEYISNQNAKFWFVCGADGFGIGERSVYASPGDVPSTDVALFNQHCANAPNIKPPEWFEGLLMQIVYASLAIGGIYLAIKILPPIFKSLSERKREGEYE